MYSRATSLTDPPADSPITSGVAWVQGVALGTTATAIAVLAVAAIGLLMLSGRLELRRGVTVIIGCFVLFGAGSIAVAFTGMTGPDAQSSHATNSGPGPLSSQLGYPDSPSGVHDPYAGASVPAAR